MDDFDKRKRDGKIIVTKVVQDQSPMPESPAIKVEETLPPQVTTYYKSDLESQRDQLEAELKDVKSKLKEFEAK